MSDIITKEKLKELGACIEGYRYWRETNKPDLFDFINHCIDTKDQEYLEYANWLIVRCMTRNQYLRYAVFAAEQVIDIFGRENDSKAPRRAIEATKAVIANDTPKTRDAARVALDATWNAARAAARNAARAAARNAARAAAGVAAGGIIRGAVRGAAWVAARNAAGVAAGAAARAAAGVEAGVAARATMQIKILRKGIEIKQEEN